MPKSPGAVARARIPRWLAAAAILLGGCALNRSFHEDDGYAAWPAAAQPNTPPPRENSPEVIDVLEKHIEAIGGRDAQIAIRTMDTEREVEVPKAIQKTHEIRDKATQRFYSKTEGPKGTVEIGFDGKRVWQRSPFFRGYLPEGDPGAKNLSRRHSELYEYKETGQKFLKVPSEAVGGKQLIVLQTRSRDFDPEGRETPVKYYFDPESFLLRRMVIGAEVTQTIDFDDYREVEGTKVPFVSTATNPNITVRSTIKSIQYNVQLDPTVFEYQPASPSPAGAAAPR